MSIDESVLNNEDEDNYKYVLVIQRRCSWPTDWFFLSWLQNSLNFRFENGFLDGNDVGSKVMNLFIFSNGPESAFREMRGRFPTLFVSVQEAAYRSIDPPSDDHIRLWPPNMNAPFELK